MSGMEALGRDEAVRAAPIAARLAHDVGKYVARVARNLPPAGAVPAPLVAMLVKDLFELQKGKRASAVLSELAGDLEPIVRDERVARARELLAEADTLEPRIRAGDADAVRRGAQIALEVESSLRALAAAAKERAR